MAMAIRGVALALLMMIALCGVCLGADYNVGESAGWTFGVDYNQWASTKKFQVGDTLVFNYNTQFHNVLQVTKEDYKSCNLKSPVATFASGSDSITVKKAGHSYFVCGFAGHCQAGLKVDISVIASSSQSPGVPSHPSPPKAIPNPAPQTPSAPGQPDCPPPPSGSGSSNVPLPPGSPNFYTPYFPLPPGFPNFGTPSLPVPQTPHLDSGESLHSANLNAAIWGFMTILFLFLLID